MKGIDVSKWQKNINFVKVARNVDFVIIRAGYGKERDPYFEQNYKNAKAAGLKVGAYWYSYGDAAKEAKACLNVIKGKTFELPIFFDLEERSQFDKGKAFCSNIVKSFCDTIIANGYKAGLYMSYSYLMNFVTKEIRDKYILWIAQYSAKCQYTGKYAIWQYSSKGKVDGINGFVDMNILYDESIIVSSNAVTANAVTIAKEVIAGKWGNGEERKKRLTAAGYNYNEIQFIVNTLLRR